MTRQVRLLTLSALMCALIIVSTLWLKFTIPGTDVMFSSQVFFVLLCGLRFRHATAFTRWAPTCCWDWQDFRCLPPPSAPPSSPPVLWVFDRLSV